MKSHLAALHSLAVLVGLAIGAQVSSAAEPAEFEQPLVRVVDLAVGESQPVTLCDGRTVTVKLVRLEERRDPICDAVREARVSVEVDGQSAELVAATYNLPQRVGAVQIDCAITAGYNSNGDRGSWGLNKDARLRLWPADSPWVRPDTFGYPVKQKWFATMTQMANEPTYVDGGESPSRKKIYYHSGLDIGGTEMRVEVMAATDGIVVSSGLEVLDGHERDTPVRKRYDVVYVMDKRGWYYRYSHLHRIDDSIRPGRILKIGDPIGVLGKEGASGGWTHLHFEIKSRQPSGEWGTQAGYAFLWQAYLQKYQPDVIAVARPHHFIWAGESVTLDADKSWSRDGGPLKVEWRQPDGSWLAARSIQRSYPKAGTYSQVVRVTDAAGHTAYDFAIVQVVDQSQLERLPPTIHPTYYPTMNLRAGEPILFTVRTFRASEGRETWDFGDGTPPVTVYSDGNASPRDPNGYAVTQHVFREPGDYIVQVERTNEHGLPATAHLHVHIDP